MDEATVLKAKFDMIMMQSIIGVCFPRLIQRSFKFVHSRLKDLKKSLPGVLSIFKKLILFQRKLWRERDEEDVFFIVFLFKEERNKMNLLSQSIIINKHPINNNVFLFNKECKRLDCEKNLIFVVVIQQPPTNYTKNQRR